MSVKQINQKSPSLSNKLELVVYMRCWPGGAMPPRTPGAILQIAHPRLRGDNNHVTNIRTNFVVVRVISSNNSSKFLSRVCIAGCKKVDPRPVKYALAGSPDD